MAHSYKDYRPLIQDFGSWILPADILGNAAAVLSDSKGSSDGISVWRLSEAYVSHLECQNVKMSAAEASLAANKQTKKHAQPQYIQPKIHFAPLMSECQNVNCSSRSRRQRWALSVCLFVCMLAHISQLTNKLAYYETKNTNNQSCTAHSPQSNSGTYFYMSETNFICLLYGLFSFMQTGARSSVSNSNTLPWVTLRWMMQM